MKAPDLRELQRQLSRIVTDSQSVSSLTGEAALLLENLKPWIQAHENGAQERLGVYSEGYFARLLQSLADDFPALRRAVSRRSGEQGFACLVADYLAENPSRDACLQNLGAGLPAFLNRHGEARDLAELSFLEWKVMESFYADSGSPRGTCPVSEASAEALASKPLVLDPSLRLMRGNWNIDQFRSGAVDQLSELPRFLEIRRREGDVRVSGLEEREYGVLERVARGESLQTICESARDLTPEELGAWTARWVNERILRGVRAE